MIAARWDALNMLWKHSFPIMQSQFTRIKRNKNVSISIEERFWGSIIIVRMAGV